MGSHDRSDRLAAELLGRRDACPPAEELRRYGTAAEETGAGPVGAHVRDCPSCAAALAFLRAEPADPAAGAPEIPSDVVRRSEELIAGLRGTEEAPVAPGWKGWLAPWGLLGAAAAAVALVVLLLPGGEPASPFLRAEVVSLAATRGPGAGIRSGDPFAVRFSLRRDAFVVLLLVSSDGDVALLDPRSGDFPASRVPAGVEASIPTPDEQRTFRLDGEPGTERFILAAFPSDPGPIGPVLETAVAAAAAAGPDPARRAGAVADAVTAAGALAHLLPLAHVP